MNKMKTALEHIKTVKGFIGSAQLSVMADNCRREEKEFFFEKFAGLAATITTMPKTYETDGQGDAATVHLHYFSPLGDWWITEKDADPAGDGQRQAFGLVALGDNYPERGYIDITTIISSNRVELDLHWTPKPLSEIRKELAA